MAARKVKVSGKVRGFKQSPAHVSQKRFLQQTKVYVMHNVPFFFLNKFGISDETAKRTRNVSETTPGFVFNLFAPRLEFGWQLEQFIHALYRLQNLHFWRGSGRSEWFVVLNPVVGSLVLSWSLYYDHPLSWKQYGLAYFAPFVWLDGWFWLLLFSLGRIAVYTGLTVGGLWLVSR